MAVRVAGVPPEVTSLFADSENARSSTLDGSATAEAAKPSIDAAMRLSEGKQARRLGFMRSPMDMQ